MRCGRNQLASTDQRFVEAFDYAAELSADRLAKVISLSFRVQDISFKFCMIKE